MRIIENIESGIAVENSKNSQLKSSCIKFGYNFIHFSR